MINTLTLNPAVDKVLYLNRVEKNITNRVISTVKAVGGKGTHVSMNLSIMGLNNRAFGLAFGGTGRYIINELNKNGVDTQFIYSDDRESRTNYILVENSSNCTTIAEKGITPTDAEIELLINRMKTVIEPNDFLVLSGDASNCSDPLIYNRITEQLKDKNLKVFLDTSGISLAEGLKSSPFLIKPNRYELSELCQMAIKSDKDVINAIESLEKFSIKVIAVSLGRDGSIIKTTDGIYRAYPPEVNVINTAGCGDSFLSALLYGFQNGLSSIDMITLATAISSATAANALSVGFDKDYAEHLMGFSKVVKIN